MMPGQEEGIAKPSFTYGPSPPIIRGFRVYFTKPQMLRTGRGILGYAQRL